MPKSSQNARNARIVFSLRLFTTHRWYKAAAADFGLAQNRPQDPVEISNNAHSLLARVRPQTSSGASLEQAGGATPKPFTNADRIGMLNTPTIRTPPPHLAGGSSKGISV